MKRASLVKAVEKQVECPSVVIIWDYPIARKCIPGSHGMLFAIFHVIIQALARLPFDLTSQDRLERPGYFRVDETSPKDRLDGDYHLASLLETSQADVLSKW